MRLFLANLNLKVPDKAAALDRLLPDLDIVDPPSPPVRAIELPDDDELIFGAAVASRATHLLTGDKKHFGRYFDDPRRTAGITIHTVRAFFSDRFGLRS